jgi:4-alpha-glucanotransferase
MPTGNYQRVSEDSLVAVLRALGVDIQDSSDAPERIRARRRQHWNTPVPPVLVADENSNINIHIRLATSQHIHELNWNLVCESGQAAKGRQSVQEMKQVRRVDYDGAAWSVFSWNFSACLPFRPPTGYHKLKLDFPGGSRDVMLIVAPLHAYQAETESGSGRWGTFIPLYALKSDRSWGTGDLTDLADLATWISGENGSHVGTLPLLAAFLGDRPDSNYPATFPFDPSPYSPVSRLFWNELFIDPERAPNLQEYSAAVQMIQSTAFQAERQSLQSTDFIDYRRAMTLKRRVLALLSRQILLHGWPNPSEPGYRGEFAKYVVEHPLTADYARFRALTETLGTTWRNWPKKSPRPDR